MITNYERAELLNARRHREVEAARIARKKAKRARRAANRNKKKSLPPKPVSKPKPLTKRAGPNTFAVYYKGMPAMEFCNTREWMELRYNTLTRYGPICQCCGAHRSKTVQLHVDHIKPRSKFPDLELDPNNLQVLCRECNIGKSNKHEDDWR